MEGGDTNLSHFLTLQPTFKWAQHFSNSISFLKELGTERNRDKDLDQTKSGEKVEKLLLASCVN